MNDQASRFSSKRSRPNPWVIMLIIILHAAVFYFLVRSFAPNVTTQVEQSVVAAFTVTVTTPEEEPPMVEPEPDEGARGDPGEDAVPQPVTAPVPKVRMKEDRPAPRASSTGSAETSGAAQAGDGTGAAGSGLGTGAGRGGGGQGGVAATKPVLLQSISDSGAFPIPPGGREARIGKSVIVRLAVSTEGRVTACSIYRASPFPETDARVCELSYQQIRFEPARDSSGQPLASTFLYQQRFFN